MLAVTWMVLLFVTMGVAAVRVGAEPRTRTVTEPEACVRPNTGTGCGHKPSAGEAVPESRAGSGSVTGLYRNHSAAYWAWRFRARTEQLQAARRRVQHLKHQLRERHTSSTASSSPAAGLNYWIGRQIWAADQIGGHGTDPWPNCPDPFDGGGSWQDTVNCENGGNWLDSPGFYRCGLQFDPMWERKYGRLCP